MATYTNEEYADIIMAYGRANGVARTARGIYHEHYPNRRLPSRYTFSNTYRRLRETGNFNYREPRINVRQYGVAVDERILQTFDEDPTRSIRNVAEMLGLTIWKVWSVLGADGRHAFHYTPVQGNFFNTPLSNLFLENVDNTAYFFPYTICYNNCCIQNNQINH